MSVRKESLDSAFFLLHDDTLVIEIMNGGKKSSIFDEPTSPLKKFKVDDPNDEKSRKNREENSAFDALPPEMLETILHFLPFQVIASSLRLVSRRCKIIATTFLNNAFLKMGKKIESTVEKIENLLLQSKTGPDFLIFSRAFNTLEIIKSQYKMLKAVTWRYTQNDQRQPHFSMCFYAGSILDDLHNFLRKAVVQPSALIPQKSNIENFIAHCKRFMNYFERYTERKINKSPINSGCKIVDLLDCLIEGREVVNFRVSSARGKNKGGIVSMRMKYVIKRGWFTCLEVPKAANEDNWWEEQRYMYLRIRRLVGSVNEHLHEMSHYQREVLAHVQGTSGPKTPPASTYSGFGEYGGRFFFYGNMNTFAYENKVQYQNIMDLEDPESEDTEDEDVEVIEHSGNDLVITVDLRCSPELAPLAIRNKLKIDPDSRFSHSGKFPELYLKLTATCPSSTANRLPPVFHWEISNRNY